MAIDGMPELPRRRWLPWAIVGLLVLLVGVAVVTYVLRQAEQIDFLGTTLVDKLTREQAEATAGVTLPASARGLRSHYSVFQDYIVHLRFEIDPSDAPALLSSLPIIDPSISSSERPPMYTEGMPDWWRPDAAATFQAVSGQVSLPSGYPEHQDVLIDTTDPAQYIVYIVAFDT
jgi:hypothetical protein